LGHPYQCDILKVVYFLTLFTILISTWFGAESACQIFTTYSQELNVAILLSSEMEEQAQIIQSRFKIWLSVHTVFNAHTLQLL